MDIVVSVIGLVILSPVIIIVSILIKFSEKGSVFYRDIRVGRYGRLFRIYKFRTMVVDAHKMGGPLTSYDDPRITKVGHFLREYKLDEIPQLINVFMGDMSLVGPRAQKPYFYRFYSKEEKKAVLSVRPGITDYGSLIFHDEEKLLAGTTDPIDLYERTIAKEKIDLQLRYIANSSVWLDIKIIWLTVATIFSTRVIGPTRHGDWIRGIREVDKSKVDV